MASEETRAHNGLSVNVGRMSGGKHEENIVQFASKMPKRGDIGVGTALPPAMSPSGARYTLKKLGKKPARID